MQALLPPRKVILRTAISEKGRETRRKVELTYLNTRPENVRSPPCLATKPASVPVSTPARRRPKSPGRGSHA